MLVFAGTHVVAHTFFISVHILPHSFSCRCFIWLFFLFHWYYCTCMVLGVTLGPHSESYKARSVLLNLFLFQILDLQCRQDEKAV